MSLPMREDKDLVCAPDTRPTDRKVYLHSAIGILIMIVFQFLPAGMGVTPIGMKMVGAFLGMVYLWSMVDAMWPSLLGLIVMGFSGFAGEGFAGMKATMLNAFGQDVVLLVLFSMVLFGALYEVRATDYIAHWFLTRKVITGRPYVFMFIFYVACYFLSALIQPMGALLVLWPITLSLLEELKVEQCDQIWPYFYVGMFFATTIGQPLFPFMGAQLVVVSAFENMSKLPVSYGAYMAMNMLMSLILILNYLLVLKFILRPDTTKMKAVDAEKIAAQNELPPMTLQQKAFIIMLPIYIILLLAPHFVPKTLPGITALETLGPLGVTMCFVVFFSIWRFRGGSFLNFKEVAYEQMSWGIFFMIAAAVYGANALSSDETGVKHFLLDVLNPLLGGRSEMAFVAIMFTVALIITNFANNAAMAVVLMPVILAFSEQMGISPTPVAMGVGMMVFVAMLTPAASPHAGMMHGRTDIYTFKDIMRIGFPCCLLALVYYIFVGYPLAKVLFG